MTEGGAARNGALTWLYLECVTPVVLILLVWPFSYITGELTWIELLKHGAVVLSSGDLAAVSFCVLLPVLLVAFVPEIEPKVKLALTSGLLISVGFYWTTKFRPALTKPDTFLDDTVWPRVAIYCFVSMAIVLFAGATAYCIKKEVAQ